jgi:hypothetical protein
MANNHGPNFELAKEIGKFEFDPLGFVERAIRWGSGELVDSAGPRKWQAECFASIGKHLADPKSRFQPLQMAIASGHGIGKSSFIGMLSTWAMSTHYDCKIVMTANTENQLLTKTVPEVSKWFKFAVTNHWFKANATSIHSVVKGHEKTWRLDAVTWSENNTEAFAGLHNKNKIILLIFDEASAISDKVWDVAEGALTDENTIILWLVFGNPTRNTGKFKDCFTRNRHRWQTWQIDSRDVEGTNKEKINTWIEDYGLDSDFVKVRVRGMFPSASLKQFISTEDVDRAFGRSIDQKSYNFAPKIITLDPAWEGGDELVIGMRQGLHFQIMRTLMKNDNDIDVANILARICDEQKPDAVFIDGGFGTGIVSAGKTLGYQWRIVWFSAKSDDQGCINKRAEMWKLMRDWIKEGGCIPADPSLHDELVGPETVARLDGKIQLESKKDMKARGQRSPNRADALALSFAYPVNKRKTPEPQNRFREPSTAGSSWMG